MALVQGKQDGVTGTAPDVAETLKIRAFVVPDDNAEFQALDALCTQGVATRLKSHFPLELSFDHVQPKAICLVAEDRDAPGKVIACTRGYLKEVLINGIKAKITYRFLVRVHPQYRRQGCFSLLDKTIITKEIKEHKVQYGTSYVLCDNEISQSMTTTDKLQKRTSTTSVGGTFETDNLTLFRCQCFHTKALIDQHPLPGKLAITRLSAEEEVVKIAAVFGKAQLLPVDLGHVFSLPLHLGTFSLCEDNVEVGFCVWDSGKIRQTGTISLDANGDPVEHRLNGVLFYNFWWQGAELSEARPLLCTLIAQVCERFAAQGIDHIFTFMPIQHISTLFEDKKSLFHADWQLKMFYCDLIKKARRVNKAFSDVFFYDPRECLI